MMAQQLMSEGVCTCSPDDTLEQAAYVMWDWGVSCLIVTDREQRPVGIITDRDIAMAACVHGTGVRTARVASVMSNQELTCSPSTSTSEVEKHMQAAHVRRVPVVDAQGKVVGILSKTDLVRSA